MKEYKVVSIKRNSEEFDGKDNHCILEKELNSYAAQGWRLVSVTRDLNNGFTLGFSLFLERDKTN